MSTIASYRYNASDFKAKSPSTVGELIGVGYTDEPGVLFTNQVATSTDATNAVADNNYLEFIIRKPVNHTMTITNISFNVARGGAANPRGIVVKTSVDGFTDELYNADISTVRNTYTSVSIDVDSTYNNLSDNVHVRIYCYTPTVSQSIDFDNFVITGEISLQQTTPAIRGIKDLVDAELDGKVRQYTWRKTPTNNLSGNGVWYDLAYASGMPTPNYYIGSIGTSTLLRQSVDGGLYHGADVSPSEKYLRLTTSLCTSSTPLPMTMMLCDYLMFYPFIDEGTTDEQVLTNTVTLPRYSGGQIMAVSQAPRGATGAYFTVNYTNQDGVSGRITTARQFNFAGTNGEIVTSATALTGSSGPFIRLMDGDSEVRSIESVTMLTPDVGLFALVIVKPLATTVIREITAPVEKDYFLYNGIIPQIKDDAFLGWLISPANSGIASSVITGDLKVIWT